MILVLLGVNLSVAGNLPAQPDPTDTVPGECRRTVGVSQGSSVPPSLVDDNGLARCSFVAEPLSSFADLLAMDKHAQQVRALYRADTAQLEHDVAYWRSQASQATPWMRQPWFVAVTTSALVSTFWVAYNETTRGRQ